MTKEEQIEIAILNVQQEEDYKNIPIDRIRKTVEFVYNSKGGNYGWFDHALWKEEDGTIMSSWKFGNTEDNGGRNIKIRTGDGGAIRHLLWFYKYFTEQFKKAP